MTVPVDGEPSPHYPQHHPHRLRPAYSAGEAAPPTTYPRLPTLGQDRMHRGSFPPTLPSNHVYPPVDPIWMPGTVQSMGRRSVYYQPQPHFAPFPADNVMAQSYGATGPGSPSYGTQDVVRGMRTSLSRPPAAQLSVPSHNPSADPIAPSYHGLIKTTTDAILLLSACDLPTDAGRGRNGDSLMKPSPPPRRIHRRLLEHERPELIRPGSVFVWDEEDAGMRRWTDGRCWSASRVSGCFLTYRELEMRKRPAGDGHGPRANQYKVEGLIKQSFSMTSTSGRKLHIVSYYTKRDLREGTLRRTSEDPRFVGEAGGEWGLFVDEREYPDPASDSVPACSEQSQSHLVELPETHLEHGSSVDALSVRTRTAPNSPHNVASSPHWRHSTGPATSPTMSLPVASGSGEVPYQEVSIPRCSAKDAFQHIPAQPTQSTRSSQTLPTGDRRAPSDSASLETTTASSVARPALKRKRSSSAGEPSVRRPFGSSSFGAPLPIRYGGIPALRSNGNLLTESNIRGALGGSMASRRLADAGSVTPGRHQEQDSAAGALLSLRGSNLGSTTESNETPLTTPEDLLSGAGTPLEGTFLRKQPSGQGSSGASSPSDRLPPPKRFSSDRDVLSKLSVRL